MILKAVLASQFLTTVDATRLGSYICDPSSRAASCRARKCAALNRGKPVISVATILMRIPGPHVRKKTIRTNLLLLSVGRQPSEHFIDGAVNIVEERRGRVRLHEQPSQTFIQRIDAREGKEPSDGNRKQVRDQAN